MSLSGCDLGEEKEQSRGIDQHHHKQVLTLASMWRTQALHIDKQLSAHLAQLKILVQYSLMKLTIWLFVHNAGVSGESVTKRMYSKAARS